MKKKYVLIGASGRGFGMYAIPLAQRLQDYAEVVGIFDVNPLRIAAVKELSGLTCPAYTNFEQMIAETKPDYGIITTVDRFHHEYIIKCLESGVDVISEKPMTIDAEKCNAIMEAEKRTGRDVIVTFNFRFNPHTAAIKQALMDGVVGEVLNVHLEWMLDTSHGADYFRRWHRRKENSGGLLIHKATHHFDIVNWFIEEEPVEVMAFGTRRFYGPTRKERGERCLTCDYKKSCEFYFDLTKSEFDNKLYLECESADGYYRDRCVFADEINIEDSMSLNVRYSKGALLSYSLVAHSPYEGWKISISGKNGRLEASQFHSGFRADEPNHTFEVYDRKGKKIDYALPKIGGTHGGSDDRLIDMIFIGGIPDPLGQKASSFAGALSCLIGIAANESIAKGHSIKVNDLVPLDKYRK